MTSPVFVNGYFRSQSVTGQQRYAIEIADRLAGLTETSEIRPSGWAFGRKGREWSEVQTRLPYLARNGVLLSLTFRAPAIHPYQVMTVHDLIVIEHPEWFSKEFAYVHTRLLRYRLPRAIAVITDSDPVRDQLREMVRPDTEVLVAPCAPTSAIRPTPLSDALVTRAGLRDVAGYFVAVGSLEPRKNLESLVLAHNSLPRSIADAYPLVVVGEAGSAFAASIRGDVSPSIHFVGRVSDAELGSLYGSASAFVSTSLAEGFGIPLVEAMACGCPLVVSDIPVFRWIAEANAVYVSPTSPDEIASALIGVTTRNRQPSIDPSAWMRFDWDQSARDVAALLRRVAADVN